MAFLQRNSCTRNSKVFKVFHSFRVKKRILKVFFHNNEYIVQARPSENTWGSMYAVGRIEIKEDETANFEIINTTTLEYNLAEGSLIII